MNVRSEKYNITGYFYEDNGEYIITLEIDGNKYTRSIGKVDKVTALEKPISQIAVDALNELYEGVRDNF